jgi:deoxyribonucleoside regulator
VASGLCTTLITDESTANDLLGRTAPNTTASGSPASGSPASRSAQPDAVR